jgi:hypothetical protein
MGYLIRGPVKNDLVDLLDVTLVVLNVQELRPGYSGLRLAGFRGEPVVWGVRFGGRGQDVFVKDLALQPVPGGTTLRFDVADRERLPLGLALASDLKRRDIQIRQKVELPRLWAGFYHCDAARVNGDGPEIAAYARKTQRTFSELMTQYRREHDSLTLFPLPWVSHFWRPMAKTFVDLARFPRRQLFRYRRPDDLSGYQAATQFDFRGEFFKGKSLAACA